VLEALAAGGPAGKAIGRALLLSPRLDVRRLTPLWEAGSPELRGLIMDVLTPRDPDWVRQRIEAALRSGRASLVTAALRAVRDLRADAFRDHVELFFQVEDPVALRAACPRVFVWA
jgi:hypothetical protein